MTVREEAHRLLDEVPEDRLTDAIDMLRRWASPDPGDVPRRQFRTTAIFDGEHDLGARAKQIVRDAWSGGEAATAWDELRTNPQATELSLASIPQRVSQERECG